MAASDFVDICSHLHIDKELDFYPILDHVNNGSGIHQTIKGVEKYDIYGILVNLGILKLRNKVWQKVLVLSVLVMHDRYAWCVRVLYTIVRRV